MDQAFTDQMKQRLEQEQRKLQQELNKIARKDPHIKDDYDAKFPQYTSPDETESGDFDDSAHEVQDYADSIGVENKLEVRLQQVNQALDKIAKGTYGMCSSCKAEQSKERLEVDPAASVCIDCANKNGGSSKK